MTKPDLTQAELALLGRMVAASTGAGPFPQDVADAFARDLSVSYARAALVKAIYDAGEGTEGDGRPPVSPGRQALRRELLGLLAPLCGDLPAAEGGSSTPSK